MLRRIKELRAARKISQQRLADAVGMSQQSINKYENHNIEPDIETLKRLADFFDTSVDYIIEHTDCPDRIRKTVPYALGDDEQQLVEDYRALPAKYRRILLDLARKFR